MRKQMKKNNHWKPINGYIVACSYCGEQVGNTAKFCKTCRTKAGREEILKENVEILKDLRSKGFCKGEVLLPVA